MPFNMKQTLFGFSVILEISIRQGTLSYDSYDCECFPNFEVRSPYQTSKPYYGHTHNFFWRVYLCLSYFVRQWSMYVKSNACNWWLTRMMSKQIDWFRNWNLYWFLERVRAFFFSFPFFFFSLFLFFRSLTSSRSLSLCILLAQSDFALPLPLHSAFDLLLLPRAPFPLLILSVIRRPLFCTQPL